MKYTLAEIARAVGGELTGTDMTVDRVMSDSRGVIDSDRSLFIALVGANHDGHDYIGELYGRGVRAFMVSKPVIPEDFPQAGFIVINDTLNALQVLAAYHRNHFKGKVVAITGSNGKTVTKEWIAQLCPENIRLFRSPRSYNSQIGVPLSILMLNGDEQIAVIEAGISQPGEMAKLAAIIRPEIGIITNIGPAHQENFAGTGEKLAEKVGLFKNCNTIIYNSDMELIDTEIKKDYPEKRLFTLGRTGAGIAVVPDESEYVRIRFGSGSKVYNFQLPFSDNVSVENAMQALSLYVVLGFEPKDIIPKLSQLQPVAMRLELREGTGGSKIINDSYNADINSLSVALDYLKSVAGNQKKVLILSDIFQTGLTTRELYGEVARLIEKNGIDHLIGIGDNISSCRDMFSCRKDFFTTTGSFISSLNRADFADKSILIKGSRPFQFEKISRCLEKQIHTTVLEVNLDAMIHNLNHARGKLRPGVKMMAMVKALSYGSGAFEVAAMLQHQRVDYLAVAFADEGVALREAGITMPIVVLNADSWSFGTMIDYRLEPEIYSFASLQMFVSELNHHGEQNYPIHISLDTGMHRLGFIEEEMDRLIYLVRNDDAVNIHSVFTHFAVSDEPAQDEFTRGQIALFDRMSNKICAAFPDRKIIRHTANTAGIERFPEAQYDMVRLGIGLYGVSSFEQEQLQLVSTLKSRIVQIKHLKAGDTVGYGRHGIITGDTTIATVPMGYADGLDRRLSNGAWSFNVNGKPAPIIGNICMDTCMINVTGIDVKEGDEVVIFGETPTAVEMAEKLGTIPYEIFTSVSARVKRVYLKE